MTPSVGHARRVVTVAAVAFVVLSGMCGCMVDGQSLTWERLGPASPSGPVPPERRDAVLEYDAARERLVVFGGMGNAGELNDVWVFSLVSETWSEVTPSGGAGPTPRFDMVSGIVGDALYISSGQFGPTVYSDVWRLDLVSLTWSQLPQVGAIPSGRYGSAGGAHRSGDGLFLSHGFDKGKKERFDDTFYYSFSEQKWIDVTPAGNLPGARCLVGTTMLGPNAFAMYGGCGSGGYAPCPSKEGFVFAVNWADGSRNWGRTQDCPAKQQRPAMAPFPGDTSRAILYGGSDAEDGGLVNVLHVPSGAWARVVPLGAAKPPKRQAHSMTLVYNTSSPSSEFAVVFGGRVSGAGLSNDLWALRGASMAGLPVNDCESFVDFRILHGLFMALSWGFLLPGGILAARFLKYVDAKPQGKPLWFFIHRIVMPLGLLLALLGFTFAWFITEKHFTTNHAIIGCIVMLLGLLQPVNAFFRPHPNPLNAKRKFWQYLHWWMGRTAAILGLVNVGIGIFHLNRHIFEDLTGLNVVYGLWAATFVVGFVVLNFLRGRNDADAHGYPAWHVWFPLITRGSARDPGRGKVTPAQSNDSESSGESVSMPVHNDQNSTSSSSSPSPSPSSSS